VDAGGLVARAADLAGVVGGEEGPHHELAGLDRADPAAHLLDDPGVLMPHGPGAVQPLDAPIGPQVRAADAGRRQPDDGVGRLQDLWLGAVLYSDVTRGMHDGYAHEELLKIRAETGRPGADLEPGNLILSGGGSPSREVS